MEKIYRNCVHLRFGFLGFEDGAVQNPWAHHQQVYLLLLQILGKKLWLLQLPDNGTSKGSWQHFAGIIIENKKTTFRALHFVLATVVFVLVQYIKTEWHFAKLFTFLSRIFWKYICLTFYLSERIEQINEIEIRPHISN